MRLEFRGDLLGNILSFSEDIAESVDIDFGENFFEGCLELISNGSPPSHVASR
jgi:hypothetical protein